MLTHLHMMVKHLWCWHICKGGERGEEKEVLPGSGCCHGGTAMPCPVHRHPCGGDQVRRLRVRCYGGAPPPYLVAQPPLGRCPPRLGQEQQRRVRAPVHPMYTAAIRAVHCLVTATGGVVPPPFLSREWGKPGWSPATVTAVFFQRGGKTGS